MILMWIGHFFVDFLLGVWPIYKTIVGLDLMWAGLILGIGQFLGDGMQLYFGYLSDKGHTRKLFIAGLLMAIGVLWASYFEAYLALFVCVLLTYLGSGAFHPSAVGFVNHLKGNRKGGVLMAIFALGGFLGLAVSQVVFTKVYTLFRGHSLVLSIPLIGFVSYLIMKTPVQKLTIQQQGKTRFKGMIQCIAQHRQIILPLYLCQVFVFGMILSIIFILPDLLLYKSAPDWLVQQGWGHLFFVLGMGTMLIPAGFLVDRYSAEQIILTFISIATVIFYIFLLVPGTFPTLMVCLLFALGAFCGPVNPMSIALGNQLIPKHVGAISAIFMGGAWCFSGLFPVLAGYFTQVIFGNPIWAMSCLGLFFPISLRLIIHLRRVISEKSPEPG